MFLLQRRTVQMLWTISAFYEILMPRSLKASDFYFARTVRILVYWSWGTLTLPWLPFSPAPSSWHALRATWCSRDLEKGRYGGVGLQVPIFPSSWSSTLGQTFPEGILWNLGNRKDWENLPGHVNSSFSVATDFWKRSQSCGWTFLVRVNSLLWDHGQFDYSASTSLFLNM